MISGFVQGVGFRQLIRAKAFELGLKGWVTNTQDGKVEALFVGPKAKIDAMIKLCQKGPFLAQVRDVKVDWSKEDKDDYYTFEIIH